MERQRFRLAPMDGLNLGLTIVASALPLLLLGPLPLLGGVPWFLSALIGGIALLVLGLYVGIVVYARPLAFELSEAGLAVEWPVRRKLVPRDELAGVELLPLAALRARFGRGARFGAGGFFGGFGWYLTAKQRFHLYISRVDPVVLVHVRHGEPWLITPRVARGVRRRAPRPPRSAPGGPGLGVARDPRYRPRQRRRSWPGSRSRSSSRSSPPGPRSPRPASKAGVSG
jgi:hypothetical protein